MGKTPRCSHWNIRLQRNLHKKSSEPEMLAESRGQPKSIVTAWMRCRLSFSLLRSAILCMRGTRNKPRQIVEELHYTDFEVDARVGRINRSTHG